jgi:hypothetical protein
MDRWYFARQKKKVGPVSTAQLRQLAASGQLRPFDMVLKEGAQKWTPAGSIPTLFRDAVERATPAGRGRSASPHAPHSPLLRPSKPEAALAPWHRIARRRIVLAAAGAALASAVIVGIWLSNGGKQGEAASSNSEWVAVVSPPVPARLPEEARKPVNSDQGATTRKDDSTVNEPARAPKEPPQTDAEQVKAAVKREMEALKRQRQNRLAALALREQNEVPPLEAEVSKVQTQIANLDHNWAKLRTQQQSLPRSFGVPTGTRFQPSTPREVRDIEVQAQQNWGALQQEFGQARAELVEKLRIAQDRLRDKRDELKKEYQQVLSEF